MRRKKQHNYGNWHKPRFNRSQPKFLKGEDARNIRTSTHGKLAIDHTTKWKTPVSQETFENLVERGLLSDLQIEQYNKRSDEEHKRNPSKAATKVKRHKNFALIMEIAKHDLTTVDGLKAFQEILLQQPKALKLIGEAQKLRASGT